jgi:hypothetical protein
MLALGATLSAPVYAIDFELTSDITGNVITNFTTGFSQRLHPQDSGLIASPGTPGFLTGFQDAHQGDLNYNAGRLFAKYVKADTEMLLKFPDQWKFFVRGSFLRDFDAGDTQFVPLSHSGYVQIADDWRLYDMWISKDFEVAGRESRLRIGRQAINWGESLFVTGGINAATAIDLERLTYPGVPIKEVVLPQQGVSWAVQPAKGVNVEAYYQSNWQPNYLPPVGSYFSTSDYEGYGANTNWFAYYDPRYAAIHGGVQAVAGGVPFVSNGMPVGPIITNPQQALNLANANNYTFCAVSTIANNSCPLQVGSPILGRGNVDPPTGGEFGIATHYKPEGSSLDFGLYFEKFHDKAPYLVFVPEATLPLGYGQELVYPKDDYLYGISANALLGQWALGSEVSYHPKDPILVDPFSCSDLGGGGADCHGNWATYRDAHRIQWNTTWWRSVNPSDSDWYAWVVRSLGAQGSNINGEFALIHYPGVVGHSYDGLGLFSDLSYNLSGATGTGIDKNAQHFGSSTSQGIVQYLDMTFDGTIIPGWQVIPNITVSAALGGGDTPNGNYNWFKGVVDTTYALTLTQNLQKWSASILYVTYRGGSPDIERNFYRDRDWWGAQVTRTF